MPSFRAHFWQRPRAHGEVIEDRTVSFLELFYDLVYVVVIARAAHRLAGQVSWRGFTDFAVVFGLIWIGWLSGSMYYELHGREDGRTRVFVFIQMLLLALLAVFTEEATGDTGAEFAVVYLCFFGVLTWLWYAVRRQDPEQYRRLTGRFLAAMIISMSVMAMSAFLADRARLVVWALFVASWLIGTALQTTSARTAAELGITATESMVERFGLFTIIVLGEVVVGVVEGISEADPSVTSVATGLAGLSIGFAYWWTYFDFVGRRLPRDTGPALGRWILSHFPVTLFIASSGAAMVSLVEHAGDGRAPTATAWLLTGSAAAGLGALVATLSALEDARRLPTVHRQVAYALGGAAVGALGIGWLRPRPWVLAGSLVVILSAVWWFAVVRRHRLDPPFRQADNPAAG